MRIFLENSVYFGVMISILTYGLGVLLQKRYRLAVFNPLLTSCLLIILVLKITRVGYNQYYEEAKCISYLLTPATICLAIPLYEKLDMLKRNWKAITVGIGSGVLANFFCVLVMSLLFKLSHKAYVTLLPKSITTAIGMGISQELGGYVTLTVVAIVITGIIGNLFASTICRICRIYDPIAIGIAIGTSSHALGTTKAIELGEIEGATSSLSIVISGLLTVVGASVFAQFI